MPTQSSPRPLAAAQPTTPGNTPTLVDAIEGIVWEADAYTFRFTFVSQQAERLLGYPLKRWLTEPTFWADHLHPEDRERGLVERINALHQPQAHELEYRMMAADGREVWLRDVVSVVVAADQSLKLRGVMVDVTERRQREWEHATITTLAATLRTARTWPALLPQVLEKLQAQFKARGAALALCLPGSNEATVELGVGVWAAVTGATLLPSEVLLSNHPYYANDTHLHPLNLMLAASDHTQAVVGALLVTQGQPVGTLWLGRPQSFTPAEAQLLMTLADMVANALQRLNM